MALYYLSHPQDMSGSWSNVTWVALNREKNGYLDIVAELCRKSFIHQVTVKVHCPTFSHFDQIHSIPCCYPNIQSTAMAMVCKYSAVYMHT